MKRPNTTARGVPPVSDYAHWGEEAEQVWYAENRYDMDHGDEPDYYAEDFEHMDDPDEDIEPENIVCAMPVKIGWKEEPA